MRHCIGDFGTRNTNFRIGEDKIGEYLSGVHAFRDSVHARNGDGRISGKIRSASKLYLSTECRAIGNSLLPEIWGRTELTQYFALKHYT